MGSETIRVLLVEDEEAHAELILLGFEPHAEKVAVTVARSLGEARAALGEASPDLALVDSQLPDGQGVELLAAGGPSLPVILMTSHGDQVLEAEAKAAGAWDYVVKSERTLVDMPRIVEAALARWRERPR